MSVANIKNVRIRDRFSDAIHQVEKCSAAVYVLGEVMQSESLEINDIMGNADARRAVADNLRILMERQEAELKAARCAFYDASGEPDAKRKLEGYLP